MHGHRSVPLYRASELIREEEERHRAWLHDTVLQVLEYLATGGYGECTDSDRLMLVAARAADELRDAIESDPDHDCMTFEEPGLIEGLTAVVNEARELSNIEVRLDVSDVAEDVDAEVGAELIAVVREALTNVRKHADASVVHVQCISQGGHVEASVIDDGVGFDPLSLREGLGMRCSMRQRMARCGGSVAIASAPGRGVVVRVSCDTCTSGIMETVA